MRHNDLKRTVIEDMTPGSRDRNSPAWKWIQEIKDTLEMKVHEACEMKINGDFRWTVRIVMLYKGPIYTFR